MSSPDAALERQPPAEAGNGHLYDARYARHYIAKSLNSAYTKYKNETLARLTFALGSRHVVDIGANVSGIVKREGSLRYQLEKLGIRYTGVDLDEAYFDPEEARALGVPEDEIYASVDYEIASVEALPFPDRSVETVVCADVIEHTDNPAAAFSEISRVLDAPDGHACIVIPSMYKLDLFDFEHIEAKRRSSHEHKLSLEDWGLLWEQAGLTIAWEHSRPIGIASGMSYLPWLHEEFVPERAEFDSAEFYSRKSFLHHKAKEICAKYDRDIDQAIAANALDGRLIAPLREGDIRAALAELEKIIAEHCPLSAEEADTLKAFFEEAGSVSFPQVYAEKIAHVFSNAAYPAFLLGNSILAVLKHDAAAEPKP